MYPKIVSLCLKMTILLLVTTGCFSCAKKSYIDVDYRLPSAADTLAGRTVFVETRDLRNDTEIFNKRAKNKFKYFTGLFALSLDMPDNQKAVLGAYELPMLFETALKQRLKKLGVGVTGAPSPSVPVFQIKINQFHINLVGQKWKADISYEASLSQDTQLVAREMVTGSAERLKVMGSGGAEKVIGDIFTEMINRLNIERLFQQAKL
ncbi:MAG: hypothetical protein HGJ94_19015 [Desulfosarcina sp.]|nr:hypothetical protein [Desulfosarcina sp.]MBC2743397.1 hypothetical protein [Desulfosarcina sp.]MBC2766307.1 hypothetical protein [Desulfosarcina sp.]